MAVTKRLVIRRSRPEEEEEQAGIDPIITRAVEQPVIAAPTFGTEPEPDYAPVVPVVAAPVFQPEPEPAPLPEPVQPAPLPSWANDPPDAFGQPADSFGPMRPPRTGPQPWRPDASPAPEPTPVRMPEPEPLPAPVARKQPEPTPTPGPERPRPVVATSTPTPEPRVADKRPQPDPAPTSAPEPQQNARIRPFRGEAAVSTKFGEKGDIWRVGYHPGTDYATPMNTEAVATDNGVIERVGRDEHYGNYVWVKHDWGTAIYGHLNAPTVTQGQRVKAGDVVGRTGNTGKSTGPHLHFETRVNGQIVDPASLGHGHDHDGEDDHAPQGDPLRAKARAAAKRAGIDPDIFERQIDQESRFDPNASSPAGAKGIAQIVPKFHPGVDPLDPDAALDYAAKLMASHLKTYGGDYRKALAAYNAGPGAVAQYGGVPPFEETQRYIATILDGKAPPRSAPQMPTSLVEELAAGQREGLVPQPVQPNSATFASPAERLAALGQGIAGIPGELAQIPGNLVAGAGRALDASGDAFASAGESFGQVFNPDTTALERLGAIGGAVGGTLAGALQPINPEHYIGRDASNALAMTPLAPLAVPHTAPRVIKAANEALGFVTNLQTIGPAASRFGQQLAGIDPSTGLRTSEVMGMGPAGAFMGGADDAARAADDALQAADDVAASASRLGSDPAFESELVRTVQAADEAAVANDVPRFNELAEQTQRHIYEAIDRGYTDDDLTKLYQQVAQRTDAPPLEPPPPSTPKFAVGDAVNPVDSQGNLLSPTPLRVTDIQELKGERYYQVEGSKTHFPEGQLEPVVPDATSANLSGVIQRDVPDDWGANVLALYDQGTPGVTVYGDKQLVYRDPNGKPIAALHLSEDGTKIDSIAADPAAGLLRGRAVATLLKTAEGRGVTGVSTTVTQDGQRLVDAYLSGRLQTISQNVTAPTLTPRYVVVNRLTGAEIASYADEAEASAHAATDPLLMVAKTEEQVQVPAGGGTVPPSGGDDGGIPPGGAGGSGSGTPPPPAGGGGSSWQPPTPNQPGRANPSPTAANVLGLRPITAGLTRADQFANSLKRTLGIGVPADEIATPAMRERARLQPIIDSQASALAAQADERVRATFTRDGMGRITALTDTAAGFPDGPTVQDMAARLPLFWDRLTEQEQAVMVWLRDSLAPYRQLWDEVGGRELHSRADVMEGGFYLPRGRADIEGADAPTTVFAGPTKRGKGGFEKAATFDSQAQGIAEGYKYASLHDALQSYVKEAGVRIADQHVANYFLNATDDAGELIAKTAADRIDPKLRAEVQALRTKIHARQVTLTRQNVRESMSDKAADVAGKRAAQAEELADRAHERFEAQLAGKNTDTHVAAAERELRVLREEQGRYNQRFVDSMNRKDEGRALDQIAARDFRAAEAADARAAKAQERYDDAVAKNRPDAVTRAAQREWQTRKQQADSLRRQANDSRTKADAFRSRRESTEATLNTLQAELDALKGRWQHAQDVARQTPRGQGQIGMVQLQGYSFPDALANAANDVLRSEGPMTGKGVAPLRVAAALNNLYRGVTATADNSALFIQGLLGLSKDQAAYKEALNVNLRAWGIQGDRMLGKFLVEFDKRAAANAMPTTSDWAREGLHIGGSETEFAVDLGVKGKFQKLANLPLIRQSNRAFGYFGDVLRLEWAQNELETIVRRTGAPPTPEDMQAIAKAVNGATGWSPHKFANDWGELADYAPRYFQSRFETLARVAPGGPATGLEKSVARGAMLRLLGGGVAITMLANAVRGEETDLRLWTYDDKGRARRNPNFMKIRDLLGQDISVFGPWDGLLGMVVETATGHPDRAFRSMGSGVVTTAWDLLSTEDSMGRKTTDTAAHFAEWLARTWSPFSVETIGGTAARGIEGVIKGDAAKAAGAALGGIFSIGGIKAAEQSYSDIRDEISQSRYGKPYSDLGQGERREIRKAAELVEKQRGFQPTDIGTTDQVAAASFQQHAKVKKDLEAAVRAHIENGVTGKALDGVLRQFMRDRYRASVDLLERPEVQEAIRRENKPLKDIYADQYWNVELPEDPKTLELDFDAMERGRLEVLAQAQAAGLTKADLAYITESGEGTFRGTRFDDPVVRAAMEQRDKDMDILRPYFKVGDEIQRLYPAARRMVEMVEAMPPEQQRIAMQDPMYNEYERMVAETKMRMRVTNKEVQAAGERRGRWQKLPTAGASNPSVPPRPPGPPPTPPARPPAVRPQVPAGR